MQGHGDGLNTVDSLALKHIKIVHVLIPYLTYVSQQNNCVLI